MSELVVGFLFEGGSALCAKVYECDTGRILSGFVGLAGETQEEVVGRFETWVRCVVGGRSCYFLCEDMMRDAAMLVKYSKTDVRKLLLGERSAVFFETKAFYYGMYVAAARTEVSSSLVETKSSKLAAREALDMRTGDLRDIVATMFGEQRPDGEVDKMVFRWLAFQRHLADAPWLIEESE